LTGNPKQSVMDFCEFNVPTKPQGTSTNFSTIQLKFSC